MLQSFCMNSSDFSPKTIDSIKTIYYFLVVSDKPEKADAIFVATGASIKTPQKAAELYHNGFSKYIFVS